MKEKSKIFIVFLFVIHSVYLQANNISNDTVFVSSKKYEGIIFGKNYPLNIIDDKNDRWNPTKKDVEEAERLLRKFVAERAKRKIQCGECIEIYLNMGKYLRQYVGRIYENGEKILEINCLWKEDIKNSSKWKTYLINYSSSSHWHWTVKVNLSEKKCFEYCIGEIVYDKIEKNRDIWTNTDKPPYRLSESIKCLGIKYTKDIKNIILNQIDSVAKLQEDSTFNLKKIIFSQCRKRYDNLSLQIVVKTDKAYDIICHFDKYLRIEDIWFIENEYYIITLDTVPCKNRRANNAPDFDTGTP